MEKKRIEFIDALRGVTMLLVVYAHILLYTYGGRYAVNPYHFNNVLALFRMPLFFFVSGFILYKIGYLWNLRNSFGFLRKKFMVQVVPTVVFGSLYAVFFLPEPEEVIWDHFKGGYWFTLALFEFFFVYTVQRLVFYYCRIPSWLRDMILALGAVGLYVLSVPEFEQSLNMSEDGINLFGVYHFRYYIYFLFGVFVKKYYARFLQMLDNGYAMGCIILTFFLAMLYVKHNGFFEDVFLNELYRFVTAMCGLTVVFAFFRKNEAYVTLQTPLGKVLQYVGTRTLDIYLLHYFFLPRGMKEMGDFFSTHRGPSVEFFLSLLFASAVIAICLLVSNIIRLSPVLGHYLFGVKKK